MSLMLLHEWELGPGPPDEPARDPIEWREWTWAFVTVALVIAGFVVGDLAGRLLHCIALVVVIRRGLQELDGVAGLGDYRQ